MKQYKVGDTIYLKAFVANVDKSDPEKTYGVNFVRGNYGVQVWPDRETIVDELPVAEPVKPVLPKGVADEMKSAKKNNYHFIGYMNKAIDNDYAETFEYAFSWGTPDAKIKILSDAWYNGYTVEKPKLYNLILGTREDSPLQAAFLKITDWDDNAHISLNAGSIPHDLTIPQYQFTQEEIDIYNKNFWIKNFDLNDYKVEVKE